MSPKFTPLVEALLSQQWIKRSNEVRSTYSEFCLGILVAHNRYLEFGIAKLIELWIPTENDSEQWLYNTPNQELQHQLQEVHQLLERIFNAIPMAFDASLNAIELLFPYYKKPTHVVVGYVHNLLQLLEYKPIFSEYLVELIMQK